MAVDVDTGRTATLQVMVGCADPYFSALSTYADNGQHFDFWAVIRSTSLTCHSNISSCLYPIYVIMNIIVTHNHCTTGLAYTIAILLIHVALIGMSAGTKHQTIALLVESSQ